MAFAAWREGKHRKFLPEVEQLSYNGDYGFERGQEVLYVTERAVFRRAAAGIELVEVAPGIDVERDILAHMAFRPRVAADCCSMDARLFKPDPMGLERDIAAKLPRYRSARVAEYLAGQAVAKAAE